MECGCVGYRLVDSHFHGIDSSLWIPVFTGMTVKRVAEPPPVRDRRYKFGATNPTLQIRR